MFRSLTVLAFFTSNLVLAQTVPGSISVNGRLTDTSGAAITGAHTLVFGLYSQSTGGAAVWTETQAGSMFSTDGLVYVELGSVTSLTPAALDGSKMYLEISVDGTTMTPRLGIVSVPYAIRASVASVATSVGTLTESNIQRRVTGTCSAGQAVRSIDAAGNVQCEPVASTGGVTAITTPAGSGLTSSGTGTVTLGLTTCANGEVLKSNGTSWACGTVGTVTTGGGLSSTTGGALSLQNCAAGESLVSNGTSWSCVPVPTAGGLVDAINFNDLTTDGTPIGSSVNGNIWRYEFAFDKVKEQNSSWFSVATGGGVLAEWIGMDFGSTPRVVQTVAVWNHYATQQYGVPA